MIGIQLLLQETPVIDKLLEEFKNLSFAHRPTSLVELLITFFFTISMSMLIVWFYKKSYRGFGYTDSFVLSLHLMALITSLVMMIISTQIAAAFSLIGALSIIRFRTAVKDTRDTAFMFFAIVIGMAGGIGFYWEGCVFTVLTGGFVVFLTKNMNMDKRDREKMLLIRWQGDGLEGRSEFERLMSSEAHTSDLLTEEMIGGRLEETYLVSFKVEGKDKEFLKALTEIAMVKEVRLLHGDKHIV